MQTNYYWFNPETSTFYGPGSSHMEIMDKNPELSKILDSLMDKDLSGKLGLYDLLLEADFVRLYFNQEKSELGVCALKNKFALKTVRKFVKNYPVIVESLFLDVKDIGVQDGLFDKDIDLYIDHGRFKPIQNS